MHKCVISQKQVTSSYLSFVLTYDKEYTTYLKTTTSLASQQSTVLSINYPIYYITVLDKHHNKYLNWTVHCKLYKIVFSVLLNTSFTLGHILHYIKHQLFLKLLTQCNIRCDLYLINGQQRHWKKRFKTSFTFWKPNPYCGQSLFRFGLVNSSYFLQEIWFSTQPKLHDRMICYLPVLTFSLFYWFINYFLDCWAPGLWYYATQVWSRWTMEKFNEDNCLKLVILNLGFKNV